MTEEGEGRQRLTNANALIAYVPKRQSEEATENETTTRSERLSRIFSEAGVNLASRLLERCDRRTEARRKAGLSGAS